MRGLKVGNIREIVSYKLQVSRSELSSSFDCDEVVQKRCVKNLNKVGAPASIYTQSSSARR